MILNKKSHSMNFYMVIDNLKEYKEYKRAKKVAKDLSVIIKIITLTIRAFEQFSKYVAVMEMISVLQNNKTLLEIHYKKYMKVVESRDNVKKS